MNPHLTPMQPPQDQGRPLLASRKSSSIMVVGKFRKKNILKIKNPRMREQFQFELITIRDVTFSAILSPCVVTDVTILNLRTKCRSVFVQKVAELARLKKKNPKNEQQSGTDRKNTH